jgi:hypothetical protein
MAALVYITLLNLILKMIEALVSQQLRQMVSR